MKSDTFDIQILCKLVGQVSGQTAVRIGQNVDCFLHPQVSLFIPSCGYCEYAISPMHTHPAYTFIYYFQPVSDFIVEEKHLAYDLAEGKCLSAMSPGIHHQEVEEEYYQSYIAIAIDTEFFNKIVLQYTETAPVFRGEVFVPHPELLGLLRCFMLEARDYRNNGLLDHLAFVITHMVVRSVSSDTNISVPLYDRFEVDRAIAYMNSHFSEKIKIEDLTEQVNISAGHFSKIFKSVTGDTPMDFLNVLRLRKARALLINNVDNITDIALKCGFNSSSYFSTCFLEKYNMTPSAYRQKYMKS